MEDLRKSERQPTPVDAGPSTATTLALDRTRMAYERTMMAWVRTATSLISFGFTIYKFLQFEIERNDQQRTAGLLNPRRFGLIMIGIGLFSLLIATIQHRRGMQSMRAHFGHVPLSESAAVAVLIAILGILAFVAVLFRQ
jgi:putative membrane protein